MSNDTAVGCSDVRNLTSPRLVADSCQSGSNCAVAKGKDLCACVLDRVSVTAKRPHGRDNSYKGKRLIRAGF